MKKILKNKQGIGLPAMLDIIVFVMLSASALFTYTSFQSQSIHRNIQMVEEKNHALMSVEAALSIIQREQSIDSALLNQIYESLGVEFETISPNLFSVSYRMVNNRSVQSFLSGQSEAVSTYQALFDHTGQETDFFLSPMITPTSLLDAFMPDYFNTYIPNVTPQTGFMNFVDLVDYYEHLAQTTPHFEMKTPNDLQNQSNPVVSGRWFINGNVTVNNLTIPPEYILFIRGNLTLTRHSTITGNVIVDGNVVIQGQGNSQQTARATFYINGHFNAANRLELGNDQRPTFVFAEGDITLGNNTFGVGYFLSINYDGRHGNTVVEGGVYTLYSSSISPNGISSHENLDPALFDEYFIPTTITVESSGDPGDGSGSLEIRFTSPKIN